MSEPRIGWSALLRLLDEALDLEGAAREQWLTGLSADAQLDVRRLLEERGLLEARDFLVTRTVTAPSMTGRHLGPWVVLRELGQGGMASVWLAERSDGAHRRQVALKLPHLARAGVIAERFLREREILSGLVHPHIAGVLDAGLDDGQPWLALEYVEGQPLTEWARARQLDPEAKVRLFLQVLEAVQHAHAQLVIHRDLKPSNVLVDERGQVKLLDFGVAKLLDGDGSTAETALTALGGRALTPQYASPEQLAGRALGTTSDVYSLGVLLYELLTGKLPYAVKRETLAAMEEAILGADLVKPSAAVSDARLARALRGDLDTIVLKALRREPRQRYPSAEALARDLERHLDSRPIQARPLELGDRLRKLMVRHRVAFTAGTLVVLALVSGLGVSLWQAREARRQAARAEAVRDFLESVFRGSDARIARDKPRGTLTAKELLDENVDRIETSFAADPETQLELLGLVGEIYGHLSEDETSERLLARRAALALAAFGPNHPVVIEGLLYDAWGSIEGQDYAAAGRSLDDAAQRLRAAGLEDGTLAANYWVARGESLRATPHAEPTRLEAFQKAIALFERHAPHDDVLVAALANAGTSLLNMDRLVEARAMYVQALEVAAHVEQRDDSAMAALWGNRSLIEAGLGDVAGVEQALEAATSLARRSVGEDSPVYWLQAAKQAAWVASRGDRPRADALFAALLARLPPDWSRNTAPASVWEAYGLALSARGQHREGVQWLARALEAVEARPAREFDVRRLQFELGAASARAGDVERARVLLTRARAEYLAKDGATDAATLAVREAWARLLFEQGELDAAQAEFQAVITATSAPSLSRAMASAGQAQVWLARGDVAGAVREIERARALFEGITGVFDVRFGPRLDLIQSEVLEAAGRRDEARTLALAALRVLERSDVEESPALRLARARASAR